MATNNKIGEKSCQFPGLFLLLPDSVFVSSFLQQTILIDNSTAHSITAEVVAKQIPGHFREFDPEANQGVGVEGHLVDHALPR
jgi:hypothetical protein